MRNRNNYRHGDYNVICDWSGFEIKASEAKMTWDGLIVRAQDWDPRHPQDYVRGMRRDQSVPFARPYFTIDQVETTDNIDPSTL